MRIPEGVDNSKYTGKVLKLDRALHGLKQAGRVWSHRIHAISKDSAICAPSPTPASTCAARGRTRTTLPSSSTTSFLSHLT